MSCSILHMRCSTTYRSWLVLYSVRMSSAHSSQMIQCEKLSYQNKFIFSPTFDLSKWPQKVANLPRMSEVSLATYALNLHPYSVFMKSMTSFEDISALYILKGFRMGYLLMKLSTFTLSMQYFLQMRKLSYYHYSVTMSKRVLSNTKWLIVCKILIWTLNLSTVLAFPLLLSSRSAQKEAMFAFVWLMLQRAKLKFISYRILLKRTEMSMPEMESRRLCKIY